MWPLLMQAIEERQAKIADGLAAAEKGRHELELAEVRAKQLLRERKQHAAEIVAHAQKRANQIIEEARISARTESERILGSARAQISQDLQEARDKLKQEVGQLAIAAAEQILMREIDAEAHQEILSKLSVQL